MKNRGVRPPVFILIGLLLAGCRSPSLNERNSPSSGETKPAPVSEDVIQLKVDDVKANGIQSVEVTEARVAPTLVVPGHVRFRSGGEAEVFSAFPGRLMGDLPLPRIGDHVAKGQHIADVEQQFAASERLQLTTTAIELQTSIDQAQQEVNLKRTEVNRAEELYEGGAIPQKELQTAQFELQQAESKLEGARHSKEQYDAVQSSTDTQPRRAAITAPISGTVIAVEATLGQQVDPAKSLMTIADLSTVWVEAAVNERDLPKARGAREAEIAAPGSDTATHQGRLVTIGSLVDPQNRTVPIIFSVDNSSEVFKIEMFVEARIPIGVASTALVIPSNALLSQESGYSVYVETSPGVFQHRAVEIGQRKDETVVITSGLRQGERVVVVGAQALRSESLKGEIPAEEDDNKDREKR